MFKCLPGFLIRMGMTENMGLGILNTFPSLGALCKGNWKLGLARTSRRS